MLSKRAVMICLMLLAALPSFGGTEQLLSLVPADAVTVGAVRIDELKSGRFAAMLFEQTSEITTDGEAILFLQEAGLDPMKDVAGLLFAMLPPAESGSDGELLLLVEGSFDPVRLSSAVARRGLIPAAAGGVAYYMIEEESDGEKDETVAVSFPSNHLVIAGTEAAVVKALELRTTGGSSFLTASNIGRDLPQIDRRASAWAMVDVQRAARMGKSMTDQFSEDRHAEAFGKALRYVSTIGVWTSEREGNLEFGGVALSADDETRVLLEDVVRGITAAWRMAAREENPEWLAVIRGFQIDRDATGVRIEGAIPISLIEDHHERIAKK